MSTVDEKEAAKNRVLTAIIAAWLVTTAMAGWAVARRSAVLLQNRGSLATHALGLNHLLREGDFEAPRLGIRGLFCRPPREDLLSKYLQHAVAPGEVIRPLDVADHPAVVAPRCNDCDRPVMAPISTAEANAINAGSVVDYVGVKPVVGRRVAAVAVLDKQWYAVVMMTDKERTDAGNNAKVALQSAWSDPMQELAWKEVAKKAVLARPDAIWTMVLPYVPPNTKLKIESTGQWKYDKTTVCGPDGDAARPNTGVLYDSAPIGALIGKLGGSSADLKSATTTPPTATMFSAGSFVLYDTGQNGGPLFLTINVPPGSFPAADAVNKIDVVISELE